MAYTFKHGDRPLEGLTVQRAVGRGGFGEVYYAVMDSGKQVALKYLRENADIELRGISHVMNLKSPHLVTIYDVRKNEAGEPFVIMEYVSGPSLRELLLADPQGMSPAKVAFLVAGIAKGLSYLHERGIVHRDLKPANIFYDDGYVKIGDYGLSKHMSISRHSGQTVSVGTVHYMAPEIGSGNYTKAIDIYALGVILYEMLTGRLPFSGASMGEILMRHLRDQPDLSGIPASFAPIIAKALAKDPLARYQDADEMLAAVMDCPEISSGAAGFDASTLSQVARAEVDADRTMTTPHVPPPPLDAREPFGAALNRGMERLDQGLERLGGGLERAGTELPEKLQRKFEKMSRRLEQKAGKLERKYGRRSGRRAAPQLPGPPASRRERLVQTLLLLAVGIMLGLLFSYLSGDHDRFPERAIVFSLYILGATAGVLLTHLVVLKRSPMPNTLFERLAAAALAGLFMLFPGFMAYRKVDWTPPRWLVAPQEEPARQFLPDTVEHVPGYVQAEIDRAMSKVGQVQSQVDQQVAEATARSADRRAGARGRSSPDRGSSQTMVQRGYHSGHLARVLFAPLAAIVLCDFRRRVADGRRGRISGGAAFMPALIGFIAANIIDADAYAFPAALTCAAVSLLVQSGAAMAGPEPVTDWVGRAGAAPPPLPEAAHREPAAPVIASPPPPPPPIPGEAPAVVASPAPAPEVVEAAAPSFAGRTARVGLLLFGKLLVLSAILIAVLQPRGEMALPIIAIATGGLFLVLARLRTNTAAIARTVIGLALAVPAMGLFAAQAAAPIADAVQEGNMARLADLMSPRMHFKTLFPLACGLILLFWPHRDRRGPIVI